MSIVCYLTGAMALTQAKEESSIGHAIAGIAVIAVGVALTFIA